MNDDVCAACCRSFEPTPTDWNPVVASLTWRQATYALERLESHPPLSRSAAQDELKALAQRAESFLPIVACDEDDLPTALPATAFACGSTSPRWSVEQVDQRLPAAQFDGRSIQQWAVGVTTAPRRLPTLEASLASLAAVGLPAPRLYIDGLVDLPASGRDLPRTVRSPAVGAWRNYYLTLVELLCTAPEADGLLVVQDDCLWPVGAPLGDYLANCRWPANHEFIASFYCCSEYTGETSGWRRFADAWVYGAVAFAFSRGAAEALVSDAEALARCRDSRAGGIDAWIGQWALRRRIPLLVPTPSLVQHMGDVSTLWETARAVGVRRASRWLGDELPRASRVLSSDSSDTSGSQAGE